MTTREKEPIRVLQIIGIVCGGGVEAVIMNYYRHIDRSRVQFDFVIDGYERSILDDEIESLGGRIYHVCPYKKNIFTYMQEIYHIVREGGYRIVHSNMNTLAVFSLFAAKVAGAPIRIAHNHSTATRGEGKRAIMKYILRPFAPLFATHRFACSQLAAEWMYGKAAVARGEVTIINNAIDLSLYAYSEEKRRRLREKLNIPADALAIGHVGRFAYQKNHAFLLDVFSRVLEQDKSAYLILVGTGELMDETRIRARKLGIDNRVLFLGLRADVADLLNAFDIFILPSHFEGLPVVAVEAQANGLPLLLSTNVSSEAVINKETKQLPLSLGIATWAERVLTMKGKRTLDTSELAKRGYDIEREAISLANFYLAV